MQNENDDDDFDDNAKFEGNADYKTCWNTYKEVLNLDLFANKLNEFFLLHWGFRLNKWHHYTFSAKRK